MTTTIKVPVKSIPKEWNLTFPEYEEFVVLTVSTLNSGQEGTMGATDAEVDKQIEEGDVVSFENTEDAVSFFKTLNNKLDNVEA